MPSVKKLLVEIINNENELKKALDPNRQAKAELYDELVKKLSLIQLTVNKAYVTLRDDGMYQVIVEYAVPRQTLLIDSENVVITSDTFKAINDLNLVNYDDMVKIQKKIDEAKKENAK